MADDHVHSVSSSISHNTLTPAGTNAPPLKIQAIDIFRASQLG